MTKIEWTEKSWNPIVGCSVTTPGCTHCYAMNHAARLLDGNPKTPHYAGTTRRVNGNAVWTGKVALAPDDVLLEPLRRKKPTMYFVNSMGDLFHESVPDAWIDRMFAMMALAPHHTFQVLTKRSKRMREYMTRPVQGPWSGRVMRVNSKTGIAEPGTDADMRVKEKITDMLATVPPDALNRAAQWQHNNGYGEGGFMCDWPLPNVWLGVSTEDQTRADERIPDLLATPAAVRFVSAEPLLGPIDFGRVRHDETYADALEGMFHDGEYEYIDGRHLPKLDWIIVGGESGPNTRPTHPDWARSIRDQCKAAGTAFFFKQWGSWVPRDDGNALKTAHFTYMTCAGQLLPAIKGHEAGAQKMMCLGKKTAGRLLDGIEHNDMPGRRA